MHQPDNATTSHTGSAGSSGRMSPPSDVPVVFLGYLHNPEGWKKGSILCFVPRWQLGILQPREGGAHRLPSENPTQVESRLASGSLKSSASWYLHCAIIGHAIVPLCTRADAKPQCEGGYGHRKQAPSQGDSRASSAVLETVSFASITPAGFSPQKSSSRDHTEQPYLGEGVPSHCRRVD